LGGLGNDTLDGGGGGDIDVLQGGKGDDIYRFGFGSGVDLLYDEEGGADKVSLFSDVSPEQVHLQESNDNLVLSLLKNNQPTGDQLILVKWFEGNGFIKRWSKAA